MVQADPSWLRLAEARGYLDSSRKLQGEKIWTAFMPTRTLDLHARLFDKVRRSQKTISFETRHQSAERTAEYQVDIRPLPRGSLEVRFMVVGLESCNGPQLSITDAKEPNVHQVCEQCSRFEVGDEWLDFEVARNRDLVSTSSPKAAYGLCPDCGKRLSELLGEVRAG